MDDCKEIQFLENAQFAKLFLTGSTEDVPGSLPYWVTLGMCGQNGRVFEAQKPADRCKFLPKNLQMGHNFNT